MLLSTLKTICSGEIFHGPSLVHAALLSCVVEAFGVTEPSFINSTEGISDGCGETQCWVCISSLHKFVSHSFSILSLLAVRVTMVPQNINLSTEPTTEKKKKK